MLIDGAHLNALLISIADGGILREYSAPPDNLGWFRADGSLIDYPVRRELNALLYSGFVRQQQTPGQKGGEFTQYVLTEKGSRFTTARGYQSASIDESFWTITLERDGVSEVYIHVSANPPDISTIIQRDSKSAKIEIHQHQLDKVPSEALLLTAKQLAATK